MNPKRCRDVICGRGQNQDLPLFEKKNKKTKNVKTTCIKNLPSEHFEGEISNSKIFKFKFYLFTTVFVQIFYNSPRKKNKKS